MYHGAGMWATCYSTQWTILFSQLLRFQPLVCAFNRAQTGVTFEAIVASFTPYRFQRQSRRAATARPSACSTESAFPFGGFLSPIGLVSASSRPSIVHPGIKNCGTPTRRIETRSPLWAAAKWHARQPPAKQPDARSPALGH